MIDLKTAINQLDADISRAERTGELLVHVGRREAMDILAWLNKHEELEERHKMLLKASDDLLAELKWRNQDEVEPVHQKVDGEGRLFCGVCNTLIPRCGKYCSECGRKVKRE